MENARPNKRARVHGPRNNSRCQSRFLKRFETLTKKTNELCTRCDSMAAFIAFSASGDVYSYGHPSFQEVMDTFFSRSTVEQLRRSMPQRSSSIPEQLQAENDSPLKGMAAPKRRRDVLESEFKTDDLQTRLGLRLLRSDAKEMDKNQLAELIGDLDEVRSAMKEKLMAAIASERVEEASSAKKND